MKRLLSIFNPGPYLVESIPPGLTIASHQTVDLLDPPQELAFKAPEGKTQELRILEQNVPDDFEFLSPVSAHTCICKDCGCLI